ncbi:XdhC family protein [Altererythrobacter sp.]|nr:XdhC family protein [Altererythrobacter sp.]
MDISRVFTFLAERQERGQPCVLVTILAVDGSSMRNAGTHMGVAHTGDYAGSISGGCIENAVVSEALEALQEGQPRIVRFGAGSPYLDIRLPCGGGVDIHFQPLSGPRLVRSCLDAIRGRRAFSVRIDAASASFAEGWRDKPFDHTTGCASFGHWPEARLLIIGHGAGVTALASLARSMDLATAVLSPDERIIDQLGASTVTVSQLARPDDTALIESDPWTAIIFLFHDHDWEIALMKRALETPHFYVGAMGGKQAHAARSQALASAGVSAQEIASIHAPIGLFHSSRDPDTLALSALAEVIRVYQQTDFETAYG